jgi:hypothetical protein
MPRVAVVHFHATEGKVTIPLVSCSNARASSRLGRRWLNTTKWEYFVTVPCPQTPTPCFFPSLSPHRLQILESCTAVLPFGQTMSLFATCQEARLLLLLFLLFTHVYGASASLQPSAARCRRKVSTFGPNDSFFDHE